MLARAATEINDAGVGRGGWVTNSTYDIGGRYQSWWSEAGLAVRLPRKSG